MVNYAFNSLTRFSERGVILVDELFISWADRFRAKPEGAGTILEASSLNPSYFCEHMLGVRPYSWQVLFFELFRRRVEGRAEYLELGDGWKCSLSKDGSLLFVDGNDVEFVVLTSRQIGKTFSLAVLSLWVALFNKVPGTAFNNSSVLITSATEDQSRMLLYEMKKMLRMGDVKMSEYLVDDEKVFGDEFLTRLLSKDDANNTSTMTFEGYDERRHGKFLLRGSKQGSIIQSFPPTSKVLGRTASVIFVDEAGKYDKITDQFVYDFLYPVGNSTQAVRAYTSTPWEPVGFFHGLVDPDGTNPRPEVVVLAFTIDAIKIENPKYYETVMKTIDSQLLDGKKDEVNRAYYCRFVKGEKSFFDPEKVHAVFTDGLKQDFDGDWEGPVDIGLDFGGTVSSHTVLTVSRLDEKSGEVIRMWHKRYEVQKDKELKDDIIHLHSIFNVQRLIYDKCPAATYFITTMEEMGWNIHPMEFRKDKVRKYGAFRSLYNKGLLLSYPDDDLKKEFLGLEKGQNAQSSVIKPAPGYTDDLLDSWLMSAYFYLPDEGSKGPKFYEWGGNSDSTPNKRRWI